MNFYEHTLVAKQDLSTSELDKIHDKYNDIINKSADIDCVLNQKSLSIEEGATLKIKTQTHD